MVKGEKVVYLFKERALKCHNQDGEYELQRMLGKLNLRNVRATYKKQHV